MVTVIPCGNEDPSLNSKNDMPYELQLSGNTNDLRTVIYSQLVEEVWNGIFKQHLGPQETSPNFSVYRTPFEDECENINRDQSLHILYMKSTDKNLTRNYNAQELELFCHNRFYGPLIVAFN